MYVGLFCRSLFDVYTSLLTCLSHLTAPPVDEAPPAEEQPAPVPIEEATPPGVTKKESRNCYISLCGSLMMHIGLF